MESGLSELEKIDILRERAGIGYAEAKQVLDEADGDVVQALIKLEQKGRSHVEWIQARGAEVLERVKALIREGNVRHIRVRTREGVLLDIPVTAGVVGAVLAPYLAIFGALAAIATNCTIEIERLDGPSS